MLSALIFNLVTEKITMKHINDESIRSARPEVITAEASMSRHFKRFSSVFSAVGSGFSI